MATNVLGERTAAAGRGGSAMALRGIHHLALNTDDMKKTVDFYCRILGMRLTHGLVTKPGAKQRAQSRGNPPFDCIRHYFFDMGGDSLLAFFELPKDLPVADRNSLGTMQHIAFATSPERYEEILARLKDSNVEIVHGPMITLPPDTWSFYFFDPNGIRLEICTDKSSRIPGDLEVVKSSIMSREEMRAELATLTADAAWIERMLDTMPQ